MENNMANRSRTLYNTAKRIRDELGKGQEILRKASATLHIDNVARTQWATILVPDVGIRVVDIAVTSNVPPVTGSGAATLDVFKEGGSDTALISQVSLATGALTAKTPSYRTLLAAANQVKGGEPIVAKIVNAQVDNASAAAPADVSVEVSYILADDERTY
jgi:hypothetical protein